MDRIWDFSEKLRRDGVDCRIDQHEESPAEGWLRWCRNQVLESLGSQWEGFVISQELYDVESKNTRFIPVGFSSNDSQFIPIELRGVTYYIITEQDCYYRLFRRISGQPERMPSPIARTMLAMAPMAVKRESR